ncbi:MAG: hypothetical protein ACYC7G_04635 [Rudaea sp.]
MTAFEKLKDLATKATQGVADLDAQYNKLHKSVDTAASDQEILNKVLDQANSAVDKATQLGDQLAQSVSGPVAAAYNKWQHNIDALSLAYAALNTQLNLGVITQQQYDDGVKKLIDDGALNEKQLSDTLEKIKEQHDLIDQTTQKIHDQIEASRQLGIYQQAELETDREVNDAMRQGHDLLGVTYTDRTKLAEAIASERDKLLALNVAYGQNQQVIKEVATQLKDWENIATQAFDSVTKDISKDIVEGGSVMSDLKNEAKTTVEAIIAQFLRLEFLGPFMRALFGPSAASGMGFSAAGLGEGLLGNMFGGGGSFGGSSSIVGSIAQAFLGGGDGSSSGGFSFSSPSSWISAGQHLWSGFQTGFSSLWSGSASAGSSILGSWSGNGVSYLGGNGLTGGMGVNLPGGGAYTPSAFGTAAGIAGGLYAGYNEYNAAGGGAAGLLGGAAYGIGTVGAMGIAGSMLAGGGAAAGMAGAMGSIGLGAIPVVGWVAMIAMAINMISGGKLFGTAASPTGGDLTETIGPGGATLTNILHEKGQKALFGGAYYKDVNQPIDPQAQAAADAFFAALTKDTSDFAASFGQTMGTLVGGTFDQSYDKNGKPTKTTDTVLGVTYAGETQAQFASRLQAENDIAVLNQLGVNATEYSQAFIGNADNLLKAIQDLGAAAQAAYADIHKGLGLLGPSGSLGDVMKEVEKLATSGETLADAYKRLVTENDAWKASIESTIVTMGKSATTTLEFADALAKAFGGASAMQTALSTFDKNFYSSGQGQAIKIANDKAQLATLGANIGQNPGETVAQFFSAFRQVEATLTPDQLAAWINYGNLLVQVNGEISSAADSYAQFMAQFGPTTSAFEQAMQKVNDSLAANIATANSLAQANGQAGASAQDIGKIISASVMQGVQAVQALETEAANLSQTLFGGDLASQIKTLTAESNAGNQMASVQLMGLLKQQADAQAQATKQQQFLQAAQLLGDLGQIGAVTGQSLGDFAKMFGIPLDKFASMLGTDQTGLNSQFKTQEDMAKSALETASNTKYSNELQADILAALDGTAAPFSTADLYAALTGNPIAQGAAAGGGAPGSRGVHGGPVASSSTTSPTGTSRDPVTVNTPTTTTAITNQTTQVVALLKDIRDRTIARDRYYSPRNSRPVSA